jgi:hypothetical protein
MTRRDLAIANALSANSLEPFVDFDVEMSHGGGFPGFPGPGSPADVQDDVTDLFNGFEQFMLPPDTADPLGFRGLFDRWTASAALDPIDLPQSTDLSG